MKPTPVLLQDAWKWILDLQCEGTHNVLGALKAALENEEERNMSFELFLKSINLNNTEYINAIRSSISTAKVFFKKKSK